jgi:hypothetical protein
MSCCLTFLISNDKTGNLAKDHLCGALRYLQQPFPESDWAVKVACVKESLKRSLRLSLSLKPYTLRESVKVIRSMAPVTLHLYDLTNRDR